MASIFDLITAGEISAFWTALEQAPYIGEELFPNEKKRGLTLQWIKGSEGLPVSLKASAFDAAAVPRGRIGFEKLSAEMPYFKESTYIDEELRQELNIVLETGNQNYIDSVLNRVFDDDARLLRGASAVREAMRMQALCTGSVVLTSNGQTFSFDYGMSDTHKIDAATKWSDATSDPVADIVAAKDIITEDTGYTLSRAICTSEVWKNLRNNEKIAKSIYVFSSGEGVVSDNKLHTYLLDEVGLDVVVVDKRYIDDTGAAVKFVPQDVFVIIPEGDLGKTWFGTTPAESDLLGSAVANVSIVDTGVAITTVNKADPVQVETIVSQICLPSFEMANTVAIINTEV